MNSPVAKFSPTSDDSSAPSPAKDAPARVQKRLGELLRVVGRKLKDKREEIGWTPEMAAKQTKIKLPQILALEYGKIEAFANPTYARGFASIYLRTLKFDERQELAPLDRALDIRPEEKIETVAGMEYRPEPLPVETREAPGTLGFRVVVACTVVMMAVLVLVGFQTYKAGIIRVTSDDGIRSDNEALNLSDPAPEKAEVAVAELAPPHAPPPAATPVQVEELAKPVKKAQAVAVARPAEPVAVPADGLYRIELVANRRSFISVVTHNADGTKTNFGTVMKAGQRKSFKGKKMDLMIAIPAAINIIYNGVDQGPYSYSVVPASFSIPAS